MPGIAGILQAAGAPQHPSSLESMVQRMRHEPTYLAEELSLPKLNALVGWVTRPGSFAEDFPAWNEDRSIGLIFTGEEFSVGQETKRFGASSEAEALIRLYEESGPRFLSSLNGWFAGLLIDLRKNQITLFNDRYGLGRIYYHSSADGFFFASEAKALLAAIPRSREIDSRSLAEYFSVGCVLQNRSLFKDLALLPPGAQWTFHADGRTERRSYFQATEWERQEPLTAAGYSEELRAVFSQLVPRYLRGRSPVGLSLTGGLDSRMVLAWAGVPSGSLPCYTFGSTYRDCADVSIARQLAALAGQPHTTIPIGDDFFRDFLGWAERTVYLTDGTMDVSGAVELYANRQAREIAPVRVTGNYGSEILRANVAFRPRQWNREFFTPEFSQLLDEAAEIWHQEAVGPRLSFIAFKQVPWHHYGRLAAEQTQLIPRSPFLDNQLVALAYRAPASLTTSPQPLLDLITSGNATFDSIDSDRALRSSRLTPFNRLARFWQEFTAKAEYAYDYGMPQWLAKVDHSFSGLRAERLFLGRHKFYHFRIWYKRQLREVLSSFKFSADSPFLLPGLGQRIVNEHLSGQNNHTLTLHKLLSIELIDRLLLRPG